MIKIRGDIIILYMCTKNHNHMMYGVWGTEWDRHNDSPPLMIPKIHIFKKWKKKKTLQDIILLHIYHKWRSHDIWFLKDKAWQNIFCHFGPFLPFRTSDNLKLQKSNFEKLKKNPEDIIILHMSTINDKHIIYGCRDMKCDGQNCLLFWSIFGTLMPKQPKKAKYGKN